MSLFMRYIGTSHCTMLQICEIMHIVRFIIVGYGAILQSMILAPSKWTTDLETKTRNVLGGDMYHIYLGNVLNSTINCDTNCQISKYRIIY